MNYNIGIIGLGVVGSAIYESLQEKKIELAGYDKYKNGGIGSLEECINCDILFLCLPTPYSEKLNGYDLSPLDDIIDKLNLINYNGIVLVKSTVTPGTTENFAIKYPNLNFVHNPEFLTARNAKYDFINQTQIVIGKTSTCDPIKFNSLINFYKEYWSTSALSICNSGESEIMKLGCNTFYAVKIQYLTELYLLCKKENLDFDKVKDMMLLNGGMGPNYTNVPGHDGSISYGGMCFPKDTNALCSFMINNNLPCQILKSTIGERNSMRNEDKIEVNKNILFT
jgi:UDPglucose 6-dehydrogenase